uniref:CSON015272 protein n=1 Tax=Culicoides sonorensis TaxID=179676 RepID=A0A336KUN7_CULSO
MIKDLSATTKLVKGLYLTVKRRRLERISIYIHFAFMSKFKYQIQ